MAGAVTVSGNTQDQTGANVQGYAVFTLLNFSAGTLPRVLGTTTIVERIHRFQANASGVISGTLFGNDQIDPAGTVYLVSILDASGNEISEALFNITGSTFNINSATPITVSPVVTPPIGDTTYQRLDGGNNATGSYVPATNNASDLGSASSGWRTGYFSTSVLSRTNNTADLGTAAIGWRTGYFATSAISAAFVSKTVNPAALGAVRLANGDFLNFRNSGNSADLNILSMNGNTTVLGDVSGGGGIQANGLFLQDIGNAGTAAGSGWLRLQNSDKVKSRNNANSADINIIGTTASDIVDVGDTSGIGLAGVIQNQAHTVTMGITQKKGSGAGNYTSASATYVRVDSTNLKFTTVIPTGWKLSANCSGAISSLTAAVNVLFALADGTADNTGIISASIATPALAGGWASFSINTVVTGDGASHTINLQYATTNALDSVTIQNTDTINTVVMAFTLMPSN